MERGRLGQEPRALERIRPARLTDAGVILGEQPAALVARIGVLAAQAGDGHLEREDRRTLGSFGHGLSDIRNPRMVPARSLDCAKRALEHVVVPAVEDVSEDLHVGRDFAPDWRRTAPRWRGSGVAGAGVVGGGSRASWCRCASAP